MKIKENAGSSGSANRFTPLVMVMMIGAIIMLVYTLRQAHQNEERRQTEIRKVIDKRNAHDDLVAEVQKSALTQPDFLKTMSAEDVAVWNLLVREAAESPQSTVLKEYHHDDVGTDTPVIVSFRGDFGEAYTVVVAVRSTDQEDRPDTLTPRMVFYISGRSGDFFRMDGLNADGGEYLREGDWKEDLPADIDWRSLAKHLTSQVYEHLGLAYSSDG